MIPRGDWKWTSALALLAVVTVIVVFWPLPKPPLPDPAEEDPAALENEDPVLSGTVLHYTVQEGDTAESIVHLFVVSMRDFRRVNRLAPDEEVRPGNRILIPPPE